MEEHGGREKVKSRFDLKICRALLTVLQAHSERLGEIDDRLLLADRSADIKLLSSASEGAVLRGESGQAIQTVRAPTERRKKGSDRRERIYLVQPERTLGSCKLTGPRGERHVELCLDASSRKAEVSSTAPYLLTEEQRGKLTHPSTLSPSLVS